MKQVSRCPPLRYGAELSSLAISGLAFSVAPYRSSAKRRKKILGVAPLHVFGPKIQINRFGERFRDGQYILVRFLFAVLLVTVPPCHAAICKSGARAQCPMESAPLELPKTMAANRECGFAQAVYFIINVL